MSNALSARKGLGMSVRLSTASPSILTSKAPFRGFSVLMEIFSNGFASARSFSSLVARVLNAPQLLHASISTFLRLVVSVFVAFFATGEVASSDLRLQNTRWQVSVIFCTLCVLIVHRGSLFACRHHRPGARHAPTASSFEAGEVLREPRRGRFAIHTVLSDTFFYQVVVVFAAVGGYRCCASREASVAVL